MTADPTELHERVAEELYYEQHPEGRRRNDWRTEHPVTRYEFLDRAAAILPIVAEEVRKAKAEAWDEGYSEAEDWCEEYREAVDEFPPRAVPYPTNPYRETGDSDEHR